MRLEQRLDYSALPERPPLRWPGGARLALWVAPNVEHYEYLPAEVRVRDYGNRVGFWRLAEVFDRCAIRCTVSLSMAVFDLVEDACGTTHEELHQVTMRNFQRLFGRVRSAAQRVEELG